MKDLSEEAQNLIKLLENEDNWVCWQDYYKVKYIQHVKSQITLWLDYIDNFSLGRVNVKVYNILNCPTARDIFSSKENKVIRKLVKSVYKTCLKKKAENERINKLNSFKPMVDLLKKHAEYESQQSDCPSSRSESCSSC